MTTVQDKKVFLRIQAISDLHLETRAMADPLQWIKPVADVLIVAGDLGSFYDVSSLKKFLLKLCPHWKHVIYVPGNHEYYFHEKLEACARSSQKTMSDLRWRARRELQTSIKNLHVLDRGLVRVEGVLFAGCTLWSNTRELARLPCWVRTKLGVCNGAYLRMHHRDRKWLKRVLCEHATEELVVVTHYPPTLKALASPSEKFACLYANKLDWMIEARGVRAWIFGHTHRNFSRRCRRKDGSVVHVYSNPLGKSHDKCRMHPSHVIALPLKGDDRDDKKKCSPNFEKITSRDV